VASLALKVPGCRNSNCVSGFDDVVDLYLLALAKASASAFYFAENGEASFGEIGPAIASRLGLPSANPCHPRRPCNAGVKPRRTFRSAVTAGCAPREPGASWARRLDSRQCWGWIAEELQADVIPQPVLNEVDVLIEDRTYLFDGATWSVLRRCELRRSGTLPRTST